MSDGGQPGHSKRDERLAEFLPLAVRGFEKAGKLGHGPGQVPRETLEALGRRLRLEDLRDERRAAHELGHAFTVARSVLAPHVDSSDAMRDPFVAEVLLHVARLTAAGQLEEGADVIAQALAQVQSGDSPSPGALKRLAQAFSGRPTRHSELLLAQMRQRILLHNAQGVADSLLARAALFHPERPAWSKGYGEQIHMMVRKGTEDDIVFLLHVAVAMARHKLSDSRKPAERSLAWMKLAAPLMTLANREPGPASLEAVLQALQQALAACKAAGQTRDLPLLEAALAEFGKRQPGRSEQPSSPTQAPAAQAPKVAPKSRAARYVDAPPQTPRQTQTGAAPTPAAGPAAATPAQPPSRARRLVDPPPAFVEEPRRPTPAAPAASHSLTELARQARALAGDTRSPQGARLKPSLRIGGVIGVLVVGTMVVAWLVPSSAPTPSSPVAATAPPLPPPNTVPNTEPAPAQPALVRAERQAHPSNAESARADAQDKPKPQKALGRQPTREAQPVAEPDPEDQARQAKAQLRDEIAARLDTLHRDWRSIEASPGYFYFRTKTGAGAQSAWLDSPSAAEAAQALLQYAQWAVPGTTLASLPGLSADQLSRGRLKPIGRVTHINRRLLFFIADFPGSPPSEVLLRNDLFGKWHLLTAAKVEGSKASFSIPEQMQTAVIDENTQLYAKE